MVTIISKTVILGNWPIDFIYLQQDSHVTPTSKHATFLTRSLIFNEILIRFS